MFKLFELFKPTNTANEVNELMSKIKASANSTYQLPSASYWTTISTTHVPRVNFYFASRPAKRWKK